MRFQPRSVKRGNGLYTQRPPHCKSGQKIKIECAQSCRPVKVAPNYRSVYTYALSKVVAFDYIHRLYISRL
jgi:hypothetical protein